MTSRVGSEAFISVLSPSKGPRYHFLKRGGRPFDFEPIRACSLWDFSPYSSLMTHGPIHVAPGFT